MNGSAILVTGGSSGLGAAVVTAVARAGGRPLVLDRHAPGDGVPWIECDLADTHAAETATRQLAEHTGGLDAVVTAAGIDVPGKLADVPTHTWEQIITVNLLATAAVIRAALPFLQTSRGSIVTIASTLGIKAVSDATAYCAAKFGVVGFTRALAAELAGTINVTLLIPGGMNTAFFNNRDDHYKPGPHAHLNDPADTAAAIMFALSQPPGCTIREMIVCAEQESSYP
ncbi:short-chain dehydrogenase [Micromonospora deserti]|uniref:Short-chain dehydrogenase n=1 Tax=Micromonospora deserti TaxID=2070366 RepID=A0A2W2BKL7_9ACTN|nr:SDR family oxidoreductase [Micromonospora deserti]PZF87961.1 short-chain dehydrogenase [Micromonospora deserti]